MDQLLTENCPDTCLALGMDCNTCMRKSAGSVARICHNLDSRAIQQLFLQLYPSNGCRPMAQAFEAAYRESSNPAIIMTAVAAAAA